MNNYNIKVGQVYLAADGSKWGHLVTDVETYRDCGDIVTTPFTAKGWNPPGNRIDGFKLAIVRYYLADAEPDWLPKRSNS